MARKNENNRPSVGQDRLRSIGMFYVSLLAILQEAILTFILPCRGTLHREGPINDTKFSLGQDVFVFLRQGTLKFDK